MEKQKSKEKRKHTAKSVMKLVNQLSSEERARLCAMLVEAEGGTEDMETFLTERRFSGGRVCPICGGVHVQRNGRRKNGTQKFICKDCGKTFSITKNTIFEGTRKGLPVWKEFMACMSEGLSLDKTAERCGITHATAFVWRHKVLDAIGEAQKGTELTGIAEADEAFLPVSYKGDKKAFEGDGCGRKPRKRGGGNHRRGLSDELVCLPCAVDRKGKAVSKVAKLGKCSAAAVEAVLGGHVSATATLCTDGDTSYRRFAKGNGNALVQIKGGKGTVKGIYHIQHLNAYHSRLKKFLASLKGVSTKYLNNYLTWVNVLGTVRGGLAQKAMALIDHAASALFSETSANVPNRPPIPILVKNQSRIKL